MSLFEKNNPFCGAIIGRRKSGKTTLFFDLLRSIWKDRFSFIVIVSPTMHLQTSIWKQIHGEGIIIVPNLSQSFLKKLFTFQNEEKKEGCCEEILVALDDIGMQGRQSDNKQEDYLSDLALTGRHYYISCVFLAQRLIQLSTAYRSQLDFFFFFGTVNNRELSLVHQEFGGGDIRDFRKMMNETVMSDDPDDRSVLLFINNNGKKIKIHKVE